MAHRDAWSHRGYVAPHLQARTLVVRAFYFPGEGYSSDCVAHFTALRVVNALVAQSGNTCFVDGSQVADEVRVK